MVAVDLVPRLEEVALGETQPSRHLEHTEHQQPLSHDLEVGPENHSKDRAPACVDEIGSASGLLKLDAHHRVDRACRTCHLVDSGSDSSRGLKVVRVEVCSEVACLRALGGRADRGQDVTEAG